MLHLRNDVPQTVTKALSVEFTIGVDHFTENRLTKELVAAPEIDDSECYRKLFEFIYSLNGKTHAQLIESAPAISIAIKEFLAAQNAQKARFSANLERRSKSAKYKPKVSSKRVQANIAKGIVQILQFPDYEIKLDGTVQKSTKKEIVAPKKVQPNTYPKVAMYKTSASKKEDVSIHRLVAIHFVNNPEHKPIVDHIDDNKHNYHYSNLQWLTVAENNAKCQIRGRRLKRVEDELLQFYASQWLPHLPAQHTQPGLRVLDDAFAVLHSVSAEPILEHLRMNESEFLSHIGTVMDVRPQYLVTPSDLYRSHNRLPGEVWRDVHDLLQLGSVRPACHMQVSNFARMRNWQGDTLHTNNRFLFGYQVATCGKKQYLLHEIVAQLFLEKPEGDPSIVHPLTVPLKIYHKNGKTHDNRAENLRWLSSKDEMKQTPLLTICKVILDELNRYKSYVPFISRIGESQSPFSTLIGTFMSSKYSPANPRPGGLFLWTP